ncbi:hypothetical protein FRB96_003707 [Tulasnella sp. 330]|nr:hypothetical protein FRB96_003707 [Tulasnella sp. 330]KAG8875489.1 hypothetical protein FRB98_007801 [Tulasnella sp. 332]
MSGDMEGLDSQMNGLKLVIPDPAQSVNDNTCLNHLCGRTDIFKIGTLQQQRALERARYEAAFQTLQRDVDTAVQELDQRINSVTAERDSFQARLTNATDEMAAIKLAKADQEKLHAQEIVMLRSQLEDARKGQAEVKGKAEENAHDAASAILSLRLGRQALETRLATHIHDRGVTLKAKDVMETPASNNGPQKMLQSAQVSHLENRLLRANSEVDRLNNVIRNLRQARRAEVSEQRSRFDAELLHTKVQCDDLLTTVIDLTNRADDDAISHELEVKQLTEEMAALRVHYNAIVTDLGTQLAVQKPSELQQRLAEAQVELAQSSAYGRAVKDLCAKQAEEIERLKMGKVVARGARSPLQLLRQACEDSAKPSAKGPPAWSGNAPPNTKL